MLSVSVVIPIYNREQIIRVCLDSVVRQTMQPSDYEIICVDDHSSDNSTQIVEEYVRDFDNVRLVRRGINSGGAGLPRNEGILAAQGEYIFFVDSDDFIGNEALQRMYAHAKNNDADIVYVKYVGENGRSVAKTTFRKGTVERAEIVNNKLFNSGGPQKLFRREFLRSKGLFFPLGQKRGEDKIFMLEAACWSKRTVIAADYDYYHAVKHDGEHLSGQRSLPDEIRIYSRMFEGIVRATRDVGERRKRLAYALEIPLSRTVKIVVDDEWNWNHQKWVSVLGDYLNVHIDESVDRLVVPAYRSTLRFLRERDATKLLAAARAVKLAPVNMEVSADGRLVVPIAGERDGKKWSDTVDLDGLVQLAVTAELVRKESSGRILIRAKLEPGLLAGYELSVKAVMKSDADGRELVVVPKRLPVTRDNAGYLYEFGVDALTEEKDLPSGKWNTFFRIAMGSKYATDCRIKVDEQIVGKDVEARHKNLELRVYRTKFGYLSAMVTVQKGEATQSVLDRIVGLLP